METKSDTQVQRRFRTMYHKTPHWILIVRASLNQHLPNGWTDRAGPIFWPARSPDITLLDIFLVHYVTVYTRVTYRDSSVKI